MSLSGQTPASPDVSIQPERDSAIWFEDGNIVVIAQHTAFRFHKGALALHSQVFRDLFSVPQPSESESESESEDTVDGPGGAAQAFGCPVVHVTDTSYDFRELLRAIYHGGVSQLHPDAKVPFSVLAALARLSHKYQLDHVLDAVVPRLQRAFPTTLDAWDRSESEGFSSSSPSPLMLDPHHYVEALNLFSLLDRPEMVPAAVYRCCQLGPGALLEGVEREDGSEALERLSPEDLELCMETVPRLMRATVRVMMGLTDLVEARMSLVCAQQPDCVMPRTCVGGLAAMLGEWRDHLAYRVDTDALGTDFSEDVDTRVHRGAMCRVCGDTLKAAHRRFRREVWAALPRLTETDVSGWNSG